MKPKHFRVAFGACQNCGGNIYLDYKADWPQNHNAKCIGRCQWLWPTGYLRQHIEAKGIEIIDRGVKTDG